MKILVIGSINVDFMTITDKTPDIGETVVGRKFKMAPGGKGANQGISVKRLGSDPGFFGMVGKDEMADIALTNFYKYGVDTNHILRSELNTGIANIIIENKDNRIVVVPGANHDFKTEDFDVSILDEYDILLLQMEINTDFVYWVIEQAHQKNKIIILNPAPYDRGMPKQILDKVTYFTPNEIEASQIFGKDYHRQMKVYPNKMIVTLGHKGAEYYNGKDYVSIPAEQVNVVDTTGAGDAFNAALAVALSKNKQLRDAVAFAVRVATKSVERLGAQDVIPSRDQFE